MKFNKILRKWCQVWCPGPKERARMWKVLKESFFSRYGQYLKEADGMSEQYAVEAETWLIFLKWGKKKELHVQACLNRQEKLKQKKMILKVVFKKHLGQCLLVKSTNRFWERRYADRERESWISSEILSRMFRWYLWGWYFGIKSLQTEIKICFWQC